MHPSVDGLCVECVRSHTLSSSDLHDYTFESECLMPQGFAKMDGDCGDDCQAEQKQSHLGYHPNRYTCDCCCNPRYSHNSLHIQQASKVM